MENNEKQEILYDLDNVRDYIDSAICYLSKPANKEMATKASILQRKRCVT